MCTRNLERIYGNSNKKVHGWKVVKDCPRGITSFYVDDFYWQKGENIAGFFKADRYWEGFDIDGQDLFHCFAKRKDARLFKKYKKSWNPSITRIIKIILSGRVYKGKTNGMMPVVNDKPAICGSEAYWDGKFHR